MPAHIKNCLLGCSVSVPITHGALNLGIWQGIYLCEHRNQGGQRAIVATIQGQPHLRSDEPKLNI
jgi:secondary thiamine-phosphate synthase enzyme